jgi:hypothetical protein
MLLLLYLTRTNGCSILASYLKDPGFEFGAILKEDILILNYCTSHQVPLVTCCDRTLKYLDTALLRPFHFLVIIYLSSESILNNL